MSDVKCIMLQLIKGLQYLHNHYVMHRDLSTKNLLIDNNNKIKISDFGLSRL